MAAHTPGEKFQDTVQASQINSMQALRGVAAWAVAIGHAVIFAAPLSGEQSIIATVRPVVSAASHAGVDLFFVISGAIMFIISHRQRGTNRFVEAAEFAFRRFMRVFPLYWISLLAMTTLLPVVAPIGATSWIRALLFVDIPAAHPVAWTLFYEVRFYLMISVVILLFRTTRETGFAVWAAGMSAVTWFHIQGVLPWTQFTTTFTTVRLTRNAKPATY